MCVVSLCLRVCVCVCVCACAPGLLTGYVVYVFVYMIVRDNSVCNNEEWLHVNVCMSCWCAHNQRKQRFGAVPTSTSARTTTNNASTNLENFVLIA